MLNDKLLQICQLLDQQFDYYNWTGFYFKNGENIGQIDIDSHTINAFSKKDQELLEFISKEIEKIL
ncbi:MAG: hypothetical protein ACK5MD_04340 [Flavobacteriales bacterium]